MSVGVSGLWIKRHIIYNHKADHICFGQVTHISHSMCVCVCTCACMRVCGGYMQIYIHICVLQSDRFSHKK